MCLPTSLSCLMGFEEWGKTSDETFLSVVLFICLFSLVNILKVSKPRNIFTTSTPKGVCICFLIVFWKNPKSWSHPYPSDIWRRCPSPQSWHSRRRWVQETRNPKRKHWWRTCPTITSSRNPKCWNILDIQNWCPNMGVTGVVMFWPHKRHQIGPFCFSLSQREEKYKQLNKASELPPDCEASPQRLVKFSESPFLWRTRLVKCCKSTQIYPNLITINSWHLLTKNIFPIIIRHHKNHPISKLLSYILGCPPSQ